MKIVKENIGFKRGQEPSKALNIGRVEEKKSQRETKGTKPFTFSGRKVKSKAFWGLTRALIFNMVKGVTEGYEKKLQIEGVGYKASLEENDLVLHVGFSHPVKIKQPKGINFLIEKNIRCM